MTPRQRVSLIALSLLILFFLGLFVYQANTGQGIIWLPFLFLIISIASIVELIRQIKMGQQPPAWDLRFRVRAVIGAVTAVILATMIFATLTRGFGVDQHTAKVVAVILAGLMGAAAALAAYYSARPKDER